MHVLLWRFRVSPGREAEFEDAYGGDGDWARLFRSGEGYLGTELMRGTDGTYLTLDRWASEDAYRAFRKARADRYAQLDARCEALTLEESCIGAVDV